MGVSLYPEISKVLYDLFLAIRNVRCHIVHLSSGNSLPIISKLKDDGYPITVETCPHYLTLTAEEILNKQTQFKCCPPIREASNQVRSAAVFVLMSLSVIII